MTRHVSLQPITAEEQAKLGRMIANDPAFARRYVRDVRLETALRSMMKSESAQAAGLVGAQRFPARWAMAAAALLVLAAGVAVSLWLNAPHDILLSGELRVMRSGETLRLAPGERIRAGDEAFAGSVVSCRLRDGSQLKLDVGSRLVFDKRARGERVRLALKEGRLFARVTDADGRFIVVSEHGAIEVLGTVFGAETVGTGTMANVFRGRVALRSEQGELRIESGQSALAAAGRPPEPSDVDPNIALLWAREKTVFQERPLGEVADWIEANSSFAVTLDPVVRQERVSIAIPEIPMREVIDVLALITGARVESDGHRIALRAK